MKTLLTFFTLILTLICISKVSSTNKNIQKLSSEIIKDTLRTFDIQFALRILPDNGWFLKLNNDSTYKYIFWSGWGSDEGKILEEGKYNLKGNLLRLKTNHKCKKLKIRKFIIIENGKNAIEDRKRIDCKESNSKIYCLYKK